MTIDESKAYAELALSKPPAKPHITRVEPVGALVWSCVVPSLWCNGAGNSRTHWSAKHKDRRMIFERMLAQHNNRLRERVVGVRPQVLMIRFTSSRPDPRSGWDKQVLDALLPRRAIKTKKGVQVRNGLGFLIDDSEIHCDSHAWWEPGPRGKGFVLVRVFGGAK